MADPRDYYGVPGVNMSVAPAPAPRNPAEYFGAGGMPVSAPPPVAAPMPDFNAMAGAALGQGPAGPAPMPIMLGGQPIAAPPPPAPISLPGAPSMANTRPAPPTSPPKPAMPMGPTAQDDREFAAFTAGLSAKKSPAPHVGGGGGVSPMGKLQADVKSAQGEVLGTFDVAKEAKGREGALEATKMVAMGDHHAELERLRQEDVAIGRAEEKQSRDILDSQLAETQRQLNEVKSRKVDVNRYMANKDPVMTLIGSVAGGMLMGLNRGSKNPFLEQLNEEMRIDIDAQKADIANEKDVVQGRMNLLQQQRAIYKDHELAEMQAKNLMYESAKQGLDAEAARYGSPIIKARTDEAVNMIDRDQKVLKKEIADRALLVAQQQAAAAAAAAKAARKEQWDHTVELIKLGLEEKKIEATGKQHDKTHDELKTLSEHMSKPELVASKKTIEDLEKKLVNPKTGEIDGSRGIPGVGHGADLREKIAPPIGQGGALDYAALVGPVPAAVRGATSYVAGLSNEERVGRQEWNRLFDAYKVAVTGAGASEGEIKSLRASFEGANTPAEQAAAIRLAKDVLKERESRIKAGASPDVASYYDARVKQERGKAPAPVKREPVK